MSSLPRGSGFRSSVMLISLGKKFVQLLAAVVHLALAAQAFLAITLAECLKGPAFPVSDEALKVGNQGLFGAYELAFVVSHLLALQGVLT
ncbi:hypothetical protein ACSWMZ_006057, partial [Pseudomonas aeruginosa]